MGNIDGSADARHAYRVPIEEYRDDLDPAASLEAHQATSRLPFVVLCSLAVAGALLTFLAERFDLGESVREIGGAIVSGAIVGAALLWFEERLAGL